MRAVPAMPPPGFDDLTPEDKLDYLQTLWNRMSARPEDVPVPAWQRTLLRERLEATSEAKAQRQSLISL